MGCIGDLVWFGWEGLGIWLGCAGLVIWLGWGCAFDRDLAMLDIWWSLEIWLDWVKHFLGCRFGWVGRMAGLDIWFGFV